MIQTKYPEYVEMQLKDLDKQIEKIYEEEIKSVDSEFKNGVCLVNVREIERVKRLIYERTKPLLDEKVRLIQNSCPSYIVTKEWY